MKIKPPFVFLLLIGCVLANFSLTKASVASYSFNYNLTIGSIGPDVIALQQILISDGFLASVASPTGYFGAGTQAALAKFQTANGISPASGYCGPKTRLFLDALGLPTGTQSTPTMISGDQQPQSTPSGASGNSLTPTLINELEPSIVEVNCYSADKSVVVSGSGTSNLNGGILYITTNYHVYNEANTGGGSPTCYAVHPESPDFSYNWQYGDYQLALHDHAYDTNTYEDVAEFTIGVPYPSSTPLNSMPSINTLPLTGMGGIGCSTAAVGDSVTVFGYPSSGNLLGVSETVTQGTVAGILPGPIYKFDGAIDHGNSGGLAILDKNDCVLGIPTLGDSGLTAGIGYIQSFTLASQPIAETNDQICQNQYGANSVYTGTKNGQGGLVCGCAAGYQWNENQTACVSAETGYQVCNNAYPNETWDGTYSSNGKYNCVCDSGYVMNSSETGCVAQPSCPIFSTYNSATNLCQCEAGYIPNGGQCISGYLYCPAHWGVGAEYDALTGGCECGYGYISNGSACVSINTICQEDVGIGSVYLGYKNLDGTYACSNPY